MNPDFFISRIKPDGFNPEVEAAGCCCSFEDKILLLKRHPKKPYGDTWGVPGGKMEKDEDMRACAIREIHEEAGLNINDPGLLFIGTLFCRIPDGITAFEYVFHLFQKRFTILPELNIGLEEHLEAKWATLDEAFSLPLIIGGREVLDYFQETKSLYNRVIASVPKL